MVKNTTITTNPEILPATHRKPTFFYQKISLYAMKRHRGQSGKREQTNIYTKLKNTHLRLLLFAQKNKDVLGSRAHY